MQSADGGIGTLVNAGSLIRQFTTNGQGTDIDIPVITSGTVQNLVLEGGGVLGGTMYSVALGGTFTSASDNAITIIGHSSLGWAGTGTIQRADLDGPGTLTSSGMVSALGVLLTGGITWINAGLLYDRSYGGRYGDGIVIGAGGGDVGTFANSGYVYQSGGLTIANGAVAQQDEQDPSHQSRQSHDRQWDRRQRGRGKFLYRPSPADNHERNCCQRGGGGLLSLRCRRPDDHQRNRRERGRRGVPSPRV